MSQRTPGPALRLPGSRWPTHDVLETSLGSRLRPGPTRRVVDLIFQAFNGYLGVAIGEHLGYAFTGIWSILAGVALWTQPLRPAGSV